MESRYYGPICLCVVFREMCTHVHTLTHIDVYTSCVLFSPLELVLSDVRFTIKAL